MVENIEDLCAELDHAPIAESRILEDRHRPLRLGVLALRNLTGQASDGLVQSWRVRSVGKDSRLIVPYCALRLRRGGMSFFIPNGKSPFISRLGYALIL